MSALMQIVMGVFVIALVGAETVTVIGFFGGTVTLESGKNENWTLSIVQWSISTKEPNIATLIGSKTITDSNKNYAGRVELNPTTGNLKIKNLRIEDGTKYNALIQYTNNEQQKHSIQLAVFGAIAHHIQFFNQVKSVESNDFKGRLTVSPTDGSLTVSPLRGEDEGEYVFSGTGSGSFPEHRVTLRVYVEKIRAVEIHHEKSYGEQNTSCNLTLHCNVTGGTDVTIHWLRDGSKKPEQLGSAAKKLVLRPTDGDLTYTCVASNLVSSRSATVDANKCYTQDSNTGFSICLLKTVLFSLGLIIMISAVIGVHVREILRDRSTGEVKSR